MAPVALFQLLQDGLTQIDLNLDPNIRTEYLNSKYLAWVLTDHHTFAFCDPGLPCNPEGLDTWVPQLSNALVGESGV